MYREIAGKTLTGKGKINQVVEKEIFISNDISKTLGCWIINHQYIPYIISESEVKIEGSFDVHIWYAYDIVL